MQRSNSKKVNDHFKARIMSRESPSLCEKPQNNASFIWLKSNVI